MHPIRIDLVSEHASPLTAVGGEDAGGQNVHVAALAIELAGMGCKVRVFTRRDDPRLPTRVALCPNAHVEHVAAGPPLPIRKDDLFAYMPGFASQLRQRWLQDPPDVVHAHFWMSGWAAAQAVDNGIALAQTFHALGVVKRRHQGSADTSPPQRLPVETALLDRVDHVIATCNDEVRELVALGARPDRVSVVPCGINPTLFRPDGSAWVRAPKGTDQSPRYRIVVVSRLVRRKGIDDVILALGYLPDTELLIAGGPSGAELEGDPEARRLHRIADECGVTRRVQLLGGMARDEVPGLMRSADLVVSTPWYEPFGIVPIEAMACAVPVVATNVGGQLDTVEPERSGLFVEPRNPAALAVAIGRLLANPGLRRRMGQVGSARVRRLFTWKRVAASTLDVYERLYAPTRRRPVSV